MTGGMVQWVTAAVLLAGLWGPLPAEARPLEAAPRQAAGDTAAAADTVRARILERARRLARPGVRDSVPVEDGQAPAPRQNGAQERGGSSPITPADSVMEALMGLPGYQASQYEGRTADFEASSRRLLLSGDEERRARFAGDGAQLEADSSIVYDDRERRVRTVGQTTLTPEEGNPVTSRTLIYDLREERGTAREARTEYQEDANWIVWGEIDSVDREAAWMSEARFTSCELDHPHYFYQARDMKVIRDQVLVARSVRLFFDDVPVAWIPFMAQSLERGRASGLLTPSFSVNDVVRTSAGYDRRVSNIGYYWAMSDYSDAEVALDWFSNNYVAIDGRLRYRWARQFLNGSIALRRFWQEDGRRQLAFNTRHNWEPSERTRVDASGRYASSSQFVREQSFDPREVTQSIDSEGGLSHRFDWGSLNLGANRKQYLSDDRVEMTLPTASLNVNTFTLFEAPPTQASWYNNLSVNANTRFNRRSRVRPAQEEEFQLGAADQVRTDGRASLSFNLGNLSLSNSVQYQEDVVRDVPPEFFPAAPTVGSDPNAVTFQEGIAFQDLGESEIGWSTGLSYRQNLLGSTTFTPNVSVTNRFARSDTIPEARDAFVAGPPRVSFGANLRTDLYGFFGGFGDYDAIRHKVTPDVRYAYSPEVTASDLQQRVFGAGNSRVRNQLTIGVNQTFEARVQPSEEDEEPVEPVDPVEDPAPLPEDPFELPLPGEEEEELEEEQEADPDAPRRLPRAETVKLLGLQTSAVTYDLVQADSLGYFLGGVTTTRIQNQVTSDFLRGLSVSVEHDLFEPPSEERERKRFAPHLTRMNFSFSVNPQTGFVRWIGGLLGLEPPDEEEVEEELEDELEDEEEDPFARDEERDTSRMMPGDDRSGRRAGAGGGRWSADLSYSLNRPRESGAGQAFGRSAAQMISGTLSFRPTEHWNVSWRTSYDFEESRFLDHMVQLRRDLHDWEANFGFSQTVTGNWSFMFEVSLRANRDVRFDHRLRSRQQGRDDPLSGLDPER